MYNKKKVLLLLFTLMIAMAAFTGCKSKSEGTATDATPTAAPAGSTTPTAAPTVTTAPTPTEVAFDENAGLKDVYADYFKMGVILNGSTVNNQIIQDLVKANFNSITCENEMKPMSLLDYNKTVSDPKYDDNPQVNFRNADPILKFAKDNGIKMRGHTLVWHSQTPRWLFTVGYSQASDAEFVSRDLMLKRMENYIKNVMDYVNTTYPGVVYAWDVVNEAINPGDGHPDGYRTESSLWYMIIGEEYIDKAFEYARKYAAPDQKLFYNDYSTEASDKVGYITKLAKRLKDEGTIDGIGMQTHIDIQSPSLMQIDQSTRTYAKLGLEVQITELDMAQNDNSEQGLLKQATRYKRLFQYIKKWKDDGIDVSSVTFWGFADNQSWLNKPGMPTYPLLFNADLTKKPAFYGVMGDPKIPLF